ncbi:MAG: glycosyl transferase family 1 [Opitutaceae bacterium BACL24 MAG-120322-bin51]|nr:MAG: glycosyl transferase family 1 [Opitutaceae bacterium BACL24 MAG-120322-bin51]
MKTLIYSNEFPPNIYGGAGVHVDYLTHELAKLMEVDVRCFGEQDIKHPTLTAKGYKVDKSAYTCPEKLQSVFACLQQGLDFNTDGNNADVVHCHTWYTHMAGILTKLNYGIPLVVTAHSLEPLRPWKREQLGGGYDCSSWVEKTAIEMADAVVCVSAGTKADVMQHFNVDPAKLHIIYNGIDPNEYYKQDATEALDRFGIDKDQPYLLFVGRITRQKGIIHLVEAIKHMHPGYQIVLCAGAPDTPEIAVEMKTAIEAAKLERDGIFWIDEMVDKPTIIKLYSGAAVFCCPSVYEPFGIINLEAMACETPVVGSAIGGIPEVVVHDETGYLVPLAQSHDGCFGPLNPEAFAKDLAHQVNRLMENPERREAFGKAGRQRAIEHFSWTSIAQQTQALYQGLIDHK